MAGRLAQQEAIPVLGGIYSWGETLSLAGNGACDRSSRCHPLQTAPSSLNRNKKQKNDGWQCGSDHTS